MTESVSGLPGEVERRPLLRYLDALSTPLLAILTAFVLGALVIWLTSGDANPNGAPVLILIDGVEADDLSCWECCLEMFDGNHPASVEAARERLKGYKAARTPLTYWQHTNRAGRGHKSRQVS